MVSLEFILSIVKKTIKIREDQEQWIKKQKKFNFSGWIRSSLDQYITTQNKIPLNDGFSAIILSAGFEKRLFPINKQKPKSMLDIKGKTILERQLEKLSVAGINDVSVIRGYLGDRINLRDIKCYDNNDYSTTGIIHSLFYAEKEMSNGFLLLYGDILFNDDILKKVLSSDKDITLVVDDNWDKQVSERGETSISDLELLKVENDKVIEIGKNLSLKDIYGEFIGIVKFSDKGADKLKELYNSQDKCLMRLISFVDMMQLMINRGVSIGYTSISGGWIEIDTFEDYRTAWSLEI